MKIAFNMPRLTRKVSFVLLIFFMACNLPKDPNNSWNNAQKEGLKVGVVMVGDQSVKKEWIMKEKKLLDSFSKENQLSVNYIEASETELIKQLENKQLHVVLGAYTKNLLFKKEVGLTVPYDRTHVWLIPKGENKLLFNLETFIYNQK